jgi:hypothetical protein
LRQLAPLLLAAALALPGAPPALAQQPISVRLGAGSLSLTADGLQPGAQYVAHLHAGSCATPSASFGALGSLTADAQGRGRLEATTASVSASGARIELTPDLADGEHVVDLHQVGGSGFACAAIPSAGAPTQLPRTGGPAALAGLAVGAVLVLAGGLGRRAGRVRLAGTAPIRGTPSPCPSPSGRGDASGPDHR